MQLLREMNMTRAMVCMLFGILPAVMPSLAAAQAKRHPLESAEGLRLHDVTAQPVTYNGKKGLRIVADTARLRERAAAPGLPAAPLLALVDGVDFSSGVIEVELAGEPAPGAGAGARGFVGVAFRVQPDNRTYDAFYLRPTNGRADDQERRNHATQYISHPDWPGSASAGRRRAGTSRTSTWCRGNGRGFGSRRAAIGRASTSTARSSRR
jgi:hypothetical protein